MLRPATPLAVTFFVAFVLLLITTLSTPIIKGIPLATINGWDYGVFGGCKDSQCVGPKIGYSADGLSGEQDSDSNSSQFTVSPTARESLSTILIVHPVAAFCALVCFCLAVAAHFRSPSHSPRFLLALLILSIPTLLITLLAFLVDILLFVPHMAWGSWVELIAVILIIASSVITCAMRRTLVSRKARKKRIAEDAEMSGANYYNSLAQQHMMADQLPRADSPPPMSGTTAVGQHGGPQYAAFEMKRPDGPVPGGRRSLDDRTPLNPGRDMSIRSSSTGGVNRRPYHYGEDVPPMPMHGRPSVDSNGNPRPPRRPSRDQYGNPIPPEAAMAMAGEMAPPRIRRQGSQGSLGSNRSDGYSRGRGGYGPPQRGYGPPRGGYGGPPPRGGYGPRGGYRGNAPPPGWSGRGRGGYRNPPSGMTGRGGAPRPTPPPGYTNDFYYNPTGRRGSSPPRYDGHVPDPGIPIGQAIEMDERTGSPAMQQTGFTQSYGFPNEGLEQERGDTHSPLRQNSNNENDRRSPTSIYSEQTYVPARAQWAQAAPVQYQQAQYSQLTVETQNSSNAAPSSNVLPISPVRESPVSPVQHSRMSPVDRVGTASTVRQRTGSESYYEDVDPRFAAEDPPPSFQEANMDHHAPLPSALTPGGAGYEQSGYAPRMTSPVHQNHPQYLQAPVPYGAADTSDSPSPLEQHSGGSTNDLDYIPDGTRSPAEGSEASHFTSISQRGINPNWRPGPPAGGSSQRPRPADVILNGNPDFTLPGVSPMGLSARGGRNQGGMGMMRVGPGPTGGSVGPAGANSSAGLTPAGRYPTDI